ncbi:hypothetical protein B0T26DRAFT_608343, partial [Lasiosphaeria miniovina]
SPNRGEGLKGGSPYRPRHQITRSIGELSSPIRLHRHHSHRAGKERDRDALGSSRQSAAALVTEGRLSLDGSRSDGGIMTPNLSPNASRRTSVLVASTDDSPVVAPPPTLNHTATFPSRRTSKENGLAKEQQKAVARESGLKRSLAELESFSTAKTRSLDDTYYSVLEKLGTLQGTIAALKELAELSRQMNSSFSSEAEELVADVSSQLDGLGQFDDQQERIESLQGRIHVGRDKIRALSDRVDAVRERIENWERADREWQERTRKRLKAVWLVTSLVIFLMLLLLATAHYASESGKLDDGSSAAVRMANDGLQTIRNVTGAGVGD